MCETFQIPEQDVAAAIAATLLLSGLLPFRLVLVGEALQDDSGDFAHSPIAPSVGDLLDLVPQFPHDTLDH